MKEKMLESNKKKEKVAIFGGTGFIGSHITKLLLEEGYDVTCVSNDQYVKENKYIEGASFRFADLNKLNQEDLEKLLSGYDYFIFAAGVDDRYVPKAPALEFFRKANVETTVKVTKAAKKVGLKKAVIISSYFTYFARKEPQLAEHHPYIKARLEQEDEAMKLADNNFSVVVLQLPYVIGAVKGKAPLFKPLVKYLHLPGPTLFMKGGTAIVTVKQIAKATRGALRKDIGSKIYPVASKNMNWDEFIKAINPKKKKIIHIPKFLIQIFGFVVDTVHKLKGKEGGLKLIKYVEMQTKELFLNLEDSKELFDSADGEIEDAFEDMVDESL